MTISAGPRKIAYTGTGANTVLSTVFPFFEANDLAVIQRITATGVETTLTVGVHYIVTPPVSPPGTGTVTPIDGATDFPSSVTWTIVRTTGLTQPTDYVENDPFSAETHERALDRLTLMVQEVSEDGSRALVFRRSETGVSSTLPSSEDLASAYLGFDATGKVPVALAAPAGTTTVSAYGATLIMAADVNAAQDVLQGEKILSGPYLSLPAAATAGSGTLYITTDTGQVFRSNGVGWFDLIVGQFLGSGLPSPSISGRMVVDITQLELLRDSGAAFLSVRSLPPNHLSGCTLSWTDADTFSVSAGMARDFADTQNLILASAMSKNTPNNTAWSAGAAGAAIPSAAQGVDRLANQWYRVFLIGGRGIATDWGLDLESASTAANLLAAAQSVSALYTKYRQIGWVRTDGSENLLEWIQIGDRFAWKVPVLGYSNAALDANPGVSITLTHAPPGSEVFAAVTMDGMATFAIFLYTGMTVAAPASTTAPGAMWGFLNGNQGAAAQTLWTDASRQVHIGVAAADDAVALYITIHGWRDPRGKDA